MLPQLKLQLVDSGTLLLVAFADEGGRGLSAALMGHVEAVDFGFEVLVHYVVDLSHEGLELFGKLIIHHFCQHDRALVNLDGVEQTLSEAYVLTKVRSVYLVQTSDGTLESDTLVDQESH